MQALHLQLHYYYYGGERVRERTELAASFCRNHLVTWQGRLTSNLPDDQEQNHVEIPLETFQQLWAAFLNPWWWLCLLLKGCPCWKRTTKTRKSSPKAIGNKIQYRCLWTFFYALIPEKLIVFLFKKIRQPPTR